MYRVENIFPANAAFSCVENQLSLVNFPTKETAMPAGMEIDGF